MTYESTKIEGQQMAYHIKTTHNGKIVEFNVVCANSESELDGLVAHHLAYLDQGKPTYPTQN